MTKNNKLRSEDCAMQIDIGMENVYHQTLAFKPSDIDSVFARAPVRRNGITSSSLSACVCA